MKFNTEVEAIIYLRVNGHAEFDGMNCNDYLGEDGDGGCAGWDGESRRCECGKLMVQLLTSQDSYGMWSAYGSTY